MKGDIMRYRRTRPDTAAITEDRPMPREETTRTCLTLRSSQLDALKDLPRATGAPVAELARRAVDAFLASRLAGYLAASRHPGHDAYESGPALSTTHR
jgi:Ribbon-helix-helix domain